MKVPQIKRTLPRSGLSPANLEVCAQCVATSQVFLLALWSEWKVLLTGGSVIALLAIVNLLTGKPMPRSVNWLVLGLTLIVSAFLAWRKEWIENGKGFIEATPLQLAKLVRGMTGVAAESRVKPYRNKWIKVTGTLSQVTHITFPMSFVRLLYGKEGVGGIGIMMIIPRWKAKLFVPLPRFYRNSRWKN